MFKKIVIVLVILMVILVAVEIVSLIHLRSTLASYKKFWNQPQTGSITYLALGDSAAQGIGASQPKNGYVGLFAKHLESKSGKKVKVVNLSVSGATIEDVIQKQIPKLSLYQADIITVEIGANDVARKYDSSDFQTRFNKLAGLLPAGTYVGNMPYFGGRIKHNPQAIDANRHIRAATVASNLILVDLQKITKDRNSIRNYASDYFHPSDRGYKNWADAYISASSAQDSKF